MGLITVQNACTFAGFLDLPDVDAVRQQYRDSEMSQSSVQGRGSVDTGYQRTNVTDAIIHDQPSA